MVKKPPSRLPYLWPVVTSGDLKDICSAARSGELSFNHSSTSILEFEKKFSSHIGADFCLALNSGTSALHIAFLCVGLSPRDIVLAPTYTFPATVMPLLHLGVRVQFIDCLPNSLQVDLDAIESAANNPRVKAIIVAHMDGLPVDMDRVNAIARARDLIVIEDCAQAFGAQVNGRSVGTFGDIGVFSLQNKKMTPGGEGGVLATRHKDFYEKAILLSYLQKRSHDEVNTPNLSDYAYTGLGFNLRIHPLAAVLAKNKLKESLDVIKKTACVFNRFNTVAQDYDFIETIDCHDIKLKRSFFSFKFVFDPMETTSISAQEVTQRLNDQGIDATTSQTRPLHLEPIFSNNLNDLIPLWSKEETFGVNTDDAFPNALRLLPKIIRLPSYFDLNEQELASLENSLRIVFDSIKQGS